MATISKGMFRIRVIDLLEGYDNREVSKKDFISEVMELSEMLCNGALVGYKNSLPPKPLIQHDYETSFLSDPPNIQINCRTPESTMDE